MRSLKKNQSDHIIIEQTLGTIYKLCQQQEGGGGFRKVYHPRQLGVGRVGKRTIAEKGREEVKGNAENH